MPQNAVVIVRYGPYKSCGIVDHRTFRLIGLQAALKENGHQSVLEKMSDWNKVELVVNGECVYTCSIKQLEFVCLPQEEMGNWTPYARRPSLLCRMHTEIHPHSTRRLVKGMNPRQI
uniref:Uncharacterized protein n=1 Tax=Oncorhynchus tshawytscha TaxID=74940 RepID=A0A8C8EGY2_ONCTS